MLIIKNSEELAKHLTKDKDLIVNEDVRIEYQVQEGELRDVKCRDLFLMNDTQRFDFTGNDFNGRDFNGRDFNGRKVSYWAFFNCYGSMECTSIEARRTSHAEPVCLDGKIYIVDDNSEEKAALLRKIAELKEEADKL